jgi:hypothetical protein
MGLEYKKVVNKHTVYKLVKVDHEHRFLIAQLELDVIAVPVGPEIILLFIHVEKGDSAADVARSRTLCCDNEDRHWRERLHRSACCVFPSYTEAMR